MLPLVSPAPLQAFVFRQQQRLRKESTRTRQGGILVGEEAFLYLQALVLRGGGVEGISAEKLRT